MPTVKKSLSGKPLYRKSGAAVELTPAQKAERARRDEILKAVASKLTKIGPILGTGYELGEAPEVLGSYGRQSWYSLKADLKTIGVCDRLDTIALMLLCSALDEYMDAKKIVEKEKMCKEMISDRGGKSIRIHPATTIMANAWARARSLLPDLLLVPSSRVKASPKKPGDGPTDPFADFLNGN